MGFRYSVAQIRKGKEGRNVENKRKGVYERIRQTNKLTEIKSREEKTKEIEIEGSKKKRSLANEEERWRWR